jgi:hypothetical protein
MKRRPGMKFTKMHGAGNDYIYVDCTQSVIDNPSQVAIDLSDRHFGIGSDGLILIKKSDKADFFMEMYNADGSQGQMCGNGIRCVGKFVYDNGLTDKTTVTIDTLAGVKILKFLRINRNLCCLKNWCTHVNPCRLNLAICSGTQLTTSQSSLAYIHIIQYKPYYLTAYIRILLFHQTRYLPD